MKLRKILEDLETLNNEFTIYAVAEPEWSGDSDAVVLQEPDDGSFPPAAGGMKYLLEVEIAKDVMETWRG